MQAFPIGRLPIRLACLLVMPRLVAGTGFHGRNDGDQPGLPPALGQHGFDQSRLAYSPLADMFDLDPGFFCQPFRVLSQFIAKPQGETWVVEDPYLVGVQVPGHPLGETHVGQSAKHQNAVIAGKHRGYLVRMPFSEERQSHSGIIMDARLVPARRVRDLGVRSKAIAPVSS